MKKISVWAAMILAALAFAGARAAAAQGLAPLVGATRPGVSGSATAAGWPLADAGKAPLLAVRAFTATGARLTDIEVHDWSTVSDHFATERALLELALREAQLLGLRRAHLWQRQTRGERVVQLTGQFQGAGSDRSLSLAIEAASLRFVGSPAQTVLAMRIYGTAHDLASLGVAYRALAEAVAQAGGTADLNATLIGSLPHVYSSTGQRVLEEHAWSAVNGRILQRFSGTYTMSDAGYAPWAAPAVVASGQTLDLQVAFHRNNYAQMTKVLVGTPMITVEY
ncbi:MAG: YwmB family TATA-box binding protein [Firmicutes bacterium]|nr:YwmB family TATA-box binding protein [Bacillota bacterium]